MSKSPRVKAKKLKEALFEIQRQTEIAVHAGHVLTLVSMIEDYLMGVNPNKGRESLNDFVSTMWVLHEALERDARLVFSILTEDPPHDT